MLQLAGIQADALSFLNSISLGKNLLEFGFADVCISQPRKINGLNSFIECKKRGEIGQKDNAARFSHAQKLALNSFLLFLSCFFVWFYLE